MRKPSKTTLLSVSVALSGAALIGAAIAILTGNAVAGILLFLAMLIVSVWVLLVVDRRTYFEATMRRDTRSMYRTIGDLSKSSSRQTQQLELIQEEVSLQTAILDRVSKQSSSPAKNSPVKPTPVSPLLPIASDVKHRKPVTQPQPIGIRAYDPLRGAEAHNWVAARKTGSALDVGLDQRYAYRGPSAPYSNEIKVAMIADEFTYHSFRPEFDIVRLTPANWRKAMTEAKPSVFICESAWEGGPVDEHPWRGKIYASVRFPEENRKALLEIIQYCRDNGIPTVFWNKEDPIHFPDRANDFVRTASLFDTVFTTAEECIPLYIRDARVNAVDVLPFAVQPRLFNPVGASEKHDVAAFAGTWYKQYPHRNDDARAIFEAVLKADVGLEIYDRNYGLGRTQFAYPDDLIPYVSPSVAYERTADIYRASRYAITLNTITDSPTMFARRAFEAAACGSVVLSNEALGVRTFFGNSALYPRQGDDISRISDSHYRRLQLSGLRVAYENTYRHRAEKILSACGIDFSTWFTPPQMVSVVSTEAEYRDALVHHQSNQEFFGTLLVVLDRNAYDGLLMKLLRDRPDGVDIVGLNELVSGSLRSRSVLNAPKLFFWFPPLSSEASPDLELLLAFSRFHEGPVSVSASTTESFVYRPLVAPHNIMTDAADLAAVLSGTAPVFQL